MGAKINFLPEDRIIQITEAPSLVDGEWVVNIDVKIDLYSDGKEDWVSTDTLNPYPFPLRSVGGDPLPGSKQLGATFFLKEGWKIRPYNDDQILLINGNLYREDGKSPYTVTVDPHTVALISTVSSLVDSTVQQLEEIEYTTFQNAVWVDVVNGDPISSGIELLGNAQYPVDNIPDATIISDERGFDTYQLLSNTTLVTGDDVEYYNIIGRCGSQTQLTVEAGADTLGISVTECYITGYFDGLAMFKDCVIGNINYVSGNIVGCCLQGIIVLNAAASVHIIDCNDGTIDNVNPPTIDCGGSGQNLSVKNYNGRLSIKNFTGVANYVVIDLSSGTIELENTVTAGTVIVRGVGNLTDSAGNIIFTGTWNGVTIVNQTSIAYLNDISYIEKYIYIDTSAAVNGDGKEGQPFNVIADAVDFAESIGWYKLMFLADATLERTLKNFTIEGIGLPIIDLNGQNVDKSEFIKVKLAGVQVGSITCREIILLDGMTGINGIYKESAMGGNVTLANNSNTTFVSASTLPVSLSHIPHVVDFGETNTHCIFAARKYSGGIELKNVNTITKLATCEFSGGRIILGSTNTSGAIRIANLPDTAITDNSNGSTIHIDGVLPGADTIAETVLSTVTS